MSYTIQKTDGQTLTQIVDGNIDQQSTDLTLIGKNASTYGVFINENFVRLLENFADVSSPNNPILGQLWYDSAQGRLKVYDGAGFKVTSGTIVKSLVPDSLSEGDLWIDSSRRQLYFYDGTGLVLAGPSYTQQQGVTGFDITDVVDSNGISHTIVLLYVAQVLIGIFSKSQFVPKNPIDGFTPSADPYKKIEIGFNEGTYSGIKFHTTATSAETLIDSNGGVLYPEDFISTTAESATLFGTTYLKNTRPLVFGDAQTNEINVSSTLFSMSSNAIDQNFKIATLPSGTAKTNIFIDAANSFVGINTDTPTVPFEVVGDTIITGDLTVNGTTTHINSTTVSVDDKNFELGKVDSPTNTTADGGGIILKGSTDKTILWDSNNLNWTSSENWNIASGKSFKINNDVVLNATSLGTNIVSATGLTSVGHLTELDVANLNINGYTISAYSGGDIILLPGASGTVNVSGKRIVSCADPASGTDVVNRNFLDETLQSIPLGLTYDITGIVDPDSFIADNILPGVFPTTERNHGTICRVFCTDTGNPYLVKTFRIDLGTGYWSKATDIPDVTIIP